MKKFAVIFALSFFAVGAVAANYDSYDESGYYDDDPRQSRSSRNEILKEAGCKAIYTLSNGRYFCVR